MINDKFIDPVSVLGGLLLDIEKPARYVGGEFGAFAKLNKETLLKTVIAFPDLYEIGMGNQAMRIIYNRMNNIPGILCDRAFAAAPDFEKLLREKNIPLYGLDTGISLASVDLLMFTVGYELGLNGILLMLDVSEIPLHCKDRDANHPIVIAGGPAVSNPLPYSSFIDAFWIGEAEAGFFDLVKGLAEGKKRGQGRAALLKKLFSHPNIWMKGKEKAKRAVYSDFSEDSTTAVFPVPSMKTVQHHGAVEIMRGCPNGCRFCHAGFWYRPMRQKSARIIYSQVREMVTKGGWREISLSSLSSGDYLGIDELVEELNNQFKNMNVSFQLPSLKVSTFSLDLLEKISVTRKSGITFAVETPKDMCQLSINKEVTRDSVILIIEEAKKRGYRGAKFYFMIGLPVCSGEKTEEEEIADFIIDIGRRTRMHFNINVGIFVPKPHTPYQWTKQLDASVASEKLFFIRDKLKPFGHKVSVSDTLISRIEGLLSRGDERAGLLCEEAFLGGSRLDAWSEYINKEKWKELLEGNKELEEDTGNCEMIESLVRIGYLKQELEKSNHSQRTASCAEKCGLCGVCNNSLKIIKNRAETEKTTPASENLHGNSRNSASLVNQEIDMVNENVNKKKDPSIYRVLFSFSKNGKAVFHGHLSLIEIFSLAFTRAGLPVMHTQGFNPLVKLEFASPLSTGISADGEIASVDFYSQISEEGFVSSLNDNLPLGIRIERAEGFFIPNGVKKHSLASLLWGFAYAGNESVDYIRASEEKSYRQSRTKDFPQDSKIGYFSLRRKEVLAVNKTGTDGEQASYFDVYRYLYPL